MSEEEKAWKSMTLGDFMDFKNGVNADKEAYGKGVKFVNIMDIFRRPAMRYDDVVGQVEISPKQHQAYSVVAGDILFNRTSETREEIAFSSVYLDDEPITFGGFVIRGRQRKRLLDQHYAVYCFSQDSIRREMIRRCQGAVRANIGQSELNGIPIKIPPLPEQRKIAAILRTWDEAIEGVDRLIQLKAQNFHCVLERLVGMADQTTKLSSVCSKELGTTFDVESGSTAYLEIGDVDVRTKKYNLQGKQKGPVKGAVKVPPGTLLVSTVRPSRGAITVTKEETYVSSAFCRLRVDDEFIFYCLLSRKFFRFLETRQSGGTYPTVKDADILKYRIPVFSDQEKKKTVQALSSLRRETELLQEQRRILSTQKRGLMQKLLTGEWPVTPDPEHLQTETKKEVSHA